MDSLFDIIEYVPNYPILLPEWPENSLGVMSTDGFYHYSEEEWKDVAGVKKDWYTKAEYYSIYWMRDGTNSYISNPSADYDIHKIIFASKERSTESITMIKKAWYDDMIYYLKKINQSPDIDPNFLKDLNKKNMRFFIKEVLSKKVN